jgi:hypothetical protein
MGNHRSPFRFQGPRLHWPPPAKGRLRISAPGKVAQRLGVAAFAFAARRPTTNDSAHQRQHEDGEARRIEVASSWMNWVRSAWVADLAAGRV